METSQRLKDLRKQHQYSYNTLRDLVYDLLGPYTPTMETLRQMHQTKDSKAAKRPDPLVMVALAHVYGVSLSDLSPVTADELKRLRDLLRRVSLWDADTQPNDLERLALAS